MDKYGQLKGLMEYVTKTVIDLPYPYRNPDGDNDYHHVVRLIMSDVQRAMEDIDAK